MSSRIKEPRKALGILGPYASSYSGYITRFFDHEEEPNLAMGKQKRFHGQLRMVQNYSFLVDIYI